MDYANVLTEYSYLVNEYLEGYESKVVCQRKHVFNYEKQHDYDVKGNFNLDEIKKWVSESEYIIFGEETGMGNFNILTYYSKLLNINLIKDKKVCVWHPGTQYRQNYQSFNNNKTNNNFFKRLYAIDLYRLSPKTEKDKTLLPYKFYDIDKEGLLKGFIEKINNPPYIILHCPSNPSKKGTQLITKQINSLGLNKDKFIYKVIHGQPNDIIMNNKNKSLFYIDQFNDRGGFGVASMESLIKSNFTFSRIDKSLIGLENFYTDKDFPIIDLGTNIESLQNKLKSVFLLEKEDLIEYAKKYVNDILYFYSPQSMVKDFEKSVLIDG